MIIIISSAALFIQFCHSNHFNSFNTDIAHLLVLCFHCFNLLCVCVCSLAQVPSVACAGVGPVQLGDSVSRAVWWLPVRVPGPWRCPEVQEGQTHCPQYVRIPDRTTCGGSPTVVHCPSLMLLFFSLSSSPPRWPSDWWGSRGAAKCGGVLQPELRISRGQTAFCDRVA